MKKAEKELRNVSRSLRAIVRSLEQIKKETVNGAAVQDVIDYINNMKSFEGRTIITMSVPGVNIPSPFIEFGTGFDKEFSKRWFETLEGDLKPGRIGMVVESAGNMINKRQTETPEQEFARKNEELEALRFQELSKEIDKAFNKAWVSVTEDPAKKLLAEMSDEILKHLAMDVIGKKVSDTIQYAGVNVKVEAILEAVSTGGIVNPVCPGCGWRHKPNK